jgi:transposase
MSNVEQVVHGQSRDIIYSVYKFMKKEKERGEVVIPLNRLQERVARATGVGLNTARRIINEGNTKAEGSEFKTPREKINKPAPKSSVNEFEEEIIRKIICNFTATQKRRPTIQAIFEAVKGEGVNFAGKIDSFRNYVKKLGFRWEKTENNRQVLIQSAQKCSSKFFDWSRKMTLFYRDLFYAWQRRYLN